MTRTLTGALNVTGAVDLDSTLNVDGNVGIGITPTTILGIKAGGSTDDAAVGGVIYKTTTQVGNVGTGEDVLASYSVKANTLNVNGITIRVVAWGTYANNANSKRLRMRFGTSGTNLIADNFLPTSEEGTWRIVAEVTRTGATTQKGVTVLTMESSVTYTQSNIGLNQTLSGAVTFQVSGEATSNNDIVVEGFTLELIDANT